MTIPKPLLLLASVALAGCTTTPVAETGGAGLTTASTLPRAAIACSDGYSTLDSDFEGSAMAGCQVLGRGHYRLLIRQEDRNVTNCSAWYAFRVQANTATEIVVDLDYERCGHRYAPKLWVADAPVEHCGADGAEKGKGIFDRLARLISRQRSTCDSTMSDAPRTGASWQPISTDRFIISEVGEERIPQARLALEPGPVPQIVSSQELFLPADYGAWLTSIASASEVSRQMLGRSLEGAPIEMISFGGKDTSLRKQLVVVGRQHPPEVAGAFALMAFTERLLEDEPIAEAFRNKFETTVVPMLNPDGVSRGHWRHSRGERDLNRDWGPFTQPETRLIRDMMEAMEIDPTREPLFFIDFHSTGRDVLYTLDKQLMTDPAGFTDDWVASYQARLPGYTVAEQPGHNPDSPVSKAWVYERFGIPTMTYEVGDETDRDLILQLGRAAAEATMETMLNHDSVAE